MVDAVIEGFFYKHRDGNIFYSKGVAHPQGFVVSYPRYVIDVKGERTDSAGTWYKRLSSLAEEYGYLLHRYRAYLRFDEFYCRPVPLVPITDIKEVYDPVKKAVEIMESSARDAVLKDVASMIRDMVMATNVKDVGVSGSVLVGLHRPNSDIDLVVYGSRNGRKVYEYLKEVVSKDPRYGRYREHNVMQLYLRRVLETPISLKQLVQQESRRVLEGLFNGREYFIRLVKHPWEVPKYGSYRCTKLGKALMKLRVVNASDAIYTPCRYEVEVVKHISGVKAEINEVYSLRGRFVEVAQDDEVIIARGTVEYVEPKNSAPYYRLYLGDENDYIIVIR